VLVAGGSGHESRATSAVGRYTQEGSASLHGCSKYAAQSRRCVDQVRDSVALMFVSSVPHPSVCRREGMFYYSDDEPPSCIMDSFRRRSDNQIMCLEILSIAFGTLLLCWAWSVHVRWGGVLQGSQCLD